VPIGAVGHANGNDLSFFGCIYSLNDRKKINASAQGTLAEAELLGEKVGASLIKQGAKDFEKEWREKYGAW
jgi:porphobilinogen deaminase